MKLNFPIEREGLLSPEWLAESVRVTIFVDAPHGPLPMWYRLVRSQPLQTTERPADGVRSEIGDFGAGVLFVHQIAGRIDIQYAAKPPTLLMNPTQPDLMHVGPAASAISTLLNLLDNSPDVFEGASRLAFGPIFIRRGENKFVTNSYLLEHVPLPILDGDTDILWQVNRPFQATTFVGTINRISKWQTGSLLAQNIPVLFGQAFHASPLPQTSIEFARVELDVNTVKAEQNVPFTDPLQVMMEVLECSKLTLANKEA